MDDALIEKPGYGDLEDGQELEKFNPEDDALAAKNTYLSKVFGMVLGQVATGEAASMITHLFPDLRTLLEGIFGKVFTAVSTVGTVGMQLWSQFGGGGGAEGKNTILTKIQYFIMTIMQGGAAAGATAQTDNTRPMRIGVITIFLSALGCAFGALYGLQKRKPFTSKWAYGGMAATQMVAAGAVAASPLTNLLPFDWIDVSIAGVVSSIISCFNLHQTDKSLEAKNPDPQHDDIFDGANLMYSAYSQELTAFVSTGGMSMLARGAKAIFDSRKAAQEAEAVQEEEQIEMLSRGVPKEKTSKSKSTKKERQGREGERSGQRERTSKSKDAKNLDRSRSRGRNQ